jgi:uncharacterized protein (TIGR02444 family)
MNKKTGKRSLWDFALALYRSPGVEETVLSLQNENGANVNLLLWACWLEHRNIQLTEAVLAEAQATIRNWDLHVVQPLRRLRRELKVPARQDATSRELRNHVKEAELLAERHCLALLEAVDVEKSPRTSTPGNNATTYLRHLGAKADISVLALATKRAEEIP